MDYKEFKTEFNLAYNNIASNQAPGLDDVEISMYLSRAQVTLEDVLYAEFEKSEEARRKLANLVVTKRLVKVPLENPSSADVVDTTTTPIASILYPEYTTVFAEPTDLRYIVNEQIRMNANADKCIKNKVIDIQPILHDELDDIIKNPYRFNLHRGLRLDTEHGIEILTKDKNIDYYQIRYIKNPEPIFIYSSLDYDDTIDGKTAPTTLQNGVDLGSLPKETHRQIVEIAAKMAYADYKN